MQTFSPLLTGIIERRSWPVAGEAELPALAEERHHVVVLLAGDASRLTESDDVAVILPELEAAFDGAVTPIVAAREAERALQLKYHFTAFPALVFLRRGQYLGAISRVRDWADYLAEIAEILSREPSKPPPFKLPEACMPAGADAGEEHSHPQH